MASVDMKGMYHAMCVLVLCMVVIGLGVCSFQVVFCVCVLCVSSVFCVFHGGAFVILCAFNYVQH